jgi:hypothetical protein
MEYHEYKHVMDAMIRHLNAFNKDVTIEDFRRAVYEAGKVQGQEGWEMAYQKETHAIYDFFKTHDLFKPLLKEGHFKFNKRGKNLIKIGNYDGLILSESKKQIKKKNRRKLKNKILKINATSGQIQRRLLKINRWIAGAAIAASIYYCYELQIEFKRQHPHFYYVHFSYIFWAEIGLLLTAMIVLLIYHSRKKSIKNKGENE